MKFSLKKLCVYSLVAIFLGNNTCYANNESIESLVGSDRYETAVKISNYKWINGSNEAILVNSKSVADALSVSTLAKIKNSPILLSNSDKINSATQKELDRLKVSKVTIIGGDKSISFDLEEGLKADGYAVSRIYGSDRVKTSEAIASELKKEFNIENFDEIFVVDGTYGLPDAAGAGSVASMKNSPLIVADRDINTTKEIIDKLGAKKIYLVGGLTEKYRGISTNTEVIGGENRTMTNVKLINRFWGNNMNKLYLVKDGSGNPSELIDAVAIGGVAGSENSPVLLVNKKKDLSHNTKKLVYNRNISKIIKVGSSLDRYTYQILEAILSDNSNTNKSDEYTNDKKHSDDYTSNNRDRGSFEYWNEANNYSTNIILSDSEIIDFNRRNLSKDRHLFDVLNSNGEHAIITRRVIMRANPVQPKGNISFDSTAETALNPWENILILKYNSDKSWAYVQHTNYKGWIPSNSFASVSREAAINYENMPFAVITNRQYSNGKILIDMGNKLPMDGDMVLIPNRQNDGTLYTTSVRFDTNSMNIGYLPFTRANIIRQVLKFQNEVYGWGGSKNAHDCSSLVQDVYKSFGIILPRNTSEQENASFGKKINLRGIKNKAEVVRNLQPGASIYLKGHVVTNLGVDKDGRQHIIHQYAGHYSNGKFISVYSGKITPINIMATARLSYIDTFTTAIDWIR